MKKITKAVIPAAGLGTRFLPATKSLPKEMFPIIDTPTLQHIVKEAVDSGITDIGIIISDEKPSISHHFSVDKKLEDRLLKLGKNDEAKMVHEIGNLVRIKFIYQDQPKGLGHAILCAKNFVNDDDFAIMLGDDLIMNKNGEPALMQLLNIYNQYHTSVLGVQGVPNNDVSRYGIVNPVSVNGRTIICQSMVEKPRKEEAPSNFAVLGRYVLTNDVFEVLEKTKPGKGGEIQLTDAIDVMMKNAKIYAYDFEGYRYDIGDKFGYVKATIDFALERDDLKEKVMNYIKDIDKK